MTPISIKILINIDFKGRVVTETFTEYKEVNDDSGFSGFGDQV